MRPVLVASFVVAVLISACATPDSENVAEDDSELNAATRLTCSVDKPCPQPQPYGKFGACVESVTIEPVAHGWVRVSVDYTLDKGDRKVVRLLGKSGYDDPLDLNGNSIEGHFTSGYAYSGGIDVQEKAANKFQGTLRLPSPSGHASMGFSASCVRRGSSDCTVGNHHYNVGESFTESDGCRSCTCTRNGTTCMEMACP